MSTEVVGSATTRFEGDGGFRGEVVLFIKKSLIYNHSAS